MSENNSDHKTKNKPYYFTAFPNSLLYGSLLSRDEKIILLFIIAKGDKGCSYSLHKWWELTGFGDYHIRRALARLAVLKLVHVIYGKKYGKHERTRYESHHYTFKPDPFSWKLTKEMHERLIDECKVLNFPVKNFEHAPFPNAQGFEIVFQHICPKFSKGRKGRVKNPPIRSAEDETTSQADQTEVIPATVVIQKPEINWASKIEKLANLSMLELAADFFRQIERVQLVRAKADDFEPQRRAYIEALDQAFTLRVEKQKNSDEETIYFLRTFEGSGLSPAEISDRLESELWKSKRNQQVRPS